MTMHASSKQQWHHVCILVGQAAMGQSLTGGLLAGGRLGAAKATALCGRSLRGMARSDAALAQDHCLELLQCCVTGLRLAHADPPGTGTCAALAEAVKARPLPAPQRGAPCHELHGSMMPALLDSGDCCDWTAGASPLPSP